MILNFQGGVKIDAKRLFLSSPIKAVDTCSAICIKAEDDAVFDIEIGDTVKRGTLLGFSGGTPVYSSIAGVFNGIIEVEGENYFTVIKEGETGEETIFESESRPLTSLTREDIILAARQFAIIDSRTGRPLWQLITEAENCKRVIIDCTEPFAHSAINHRICIEKAKSVVGGAKIILHAIGALKCVFAFEHSKKAVTESLSAYATDEQLFAIATMAEKYPYGDRALLDGIYVKTLKEGELPTEKGVLIVGVEAAVALFDAMVSGKPQTFRYITVCGEGMEKGGNYFLPRGITMHEVSHLCGGFPEDRLIIENSLLSGDIMGGAITDSTIAVMTSVPDKKRRTDCISCGKCAEACPAKLFPAEALLGDNLQIKKECLGCGACEYICPSGIPLLRFIKGKKAKNVSKK